MVTAHTSPFPRVSDAIAWLPSGGEDDSASSPAEQIEFGRR